MQNDQFLKGKFRMFLNFFHIRKLPAANLQS